MPSLNGHQIYWIVATLTIILIGYALINGLWILYLYDPKWSYTTGAVILLAFLITLSNLK